MIEEWAKFFFYAVIFIVDLDFLYWNVEAPKTHLWVCLSVNKGRLATRNYFQVHPLSTDGAIMLFARRYFHLLPCGCKLGWLCRNMGTNTILLLAHFGMKHNLCHFRHANGHSGAI